MRLSAFFSPVNSAHLLQHVVDEARTWLEWLDRIAAKRHESTTQAGKTKSIDMDYWKNKACLLTGGTAGLGLVLAETLARQGARVAINGRDPQRLAEAAEQLRATGAEILPLAGDITESGFAQQLVAETIEAFGQLDFVCHAAGRSMRGELLSTSQEDFEALWRVNTGAAFGLAQAAAESLTASRGHLVLIGSLASRVATRYLGAYPASKFPLAAIAQQLRIEQGSHGLHTLLVCPGPVASTDASQQEADRYKAKEAGLPDAASRPGGGARVKALDPHDLCERLLRACERRQSELVLPRKARLLFVLNQLSPQLGDWLLRKLGS